MNRYGDHGLLSLRELEVRLTDQPSQKLYSAQNRRHGIAKFVAGYREEGVTGLHGFRQQFVLLSQLRVAPT